MPRWHADRRDFLCFFRDTNGRAFGLGPFWMSTFACSVVLDIAKSIVRPIWEPRLDTHHS